MQVGSAHSIALVAVLRQAGASSWTTPTTISTASDATAPDVTIDDRGRATVIWPGTEGTNRTVDVARGDVTSGGWGIAQCLGTSSPVGPDGASDLPAPAVTTYSIGNVTSMWMDFDGAYDRVVAARAPVVGFTAVGPACVFDTRPGESPGALRTVNPTKVSPANTLQVKVTDLTAYVPTTDVGAVSLNVAVTNTAGFLTVYPSANAHPPPALTTPRARPSPTPSSHPSPIPAPSASTASTPLTSSSTSTDGSPAERCRCQRHRRAAGVSRGA